MRLPGTLKQLVDGLTSLGLTPTSFQFDADGHLLGLETVAVSKSVEASPPPPSKVTPHRPRKSAIGSIHLTPPAEA